MSPKAKFTKEELKLYQLTFMSSISEAQTFDDIYARLGSVADECLDVLQKDYDLSKDNAKTLFEHVWIHTFGIGTLCASGVCNFSYEQITEMLTQDFTAMMMLMKSGKPNQPTTQKLEGEGLVDMTFTTDPEDYLQMEFVPIVESEGEK